MKIKKQKIFSDILLNIVATVIPIMVLQLIIYPMISARTLDESYGKMITTVSIVSVVCNTIGNVLNNVRLLYNEQYKEKKETGDFNLLLLIGAVLGTLVVLVAEILMFDGITAIQVLLGCAIGLVMGGYAYYSVAFRLTLDYKRIVVSNVVLGLGFCIGFCLFFLTMQWEWVYIVGYGIALVYVAGKCDLWKENLSRTSLWRSTLRNTVLLLLSGILYSMLNYADKLLIYPLIGGEAVAIYYIASIFGKIVSMAVSPINSVFLTYLAKMKSMSRNYIILVILASAAMAAIGYGACMLTARPILTILYRQHVDEAMKYMPLTSAIAMVTMLISVYYPFVLKFCDMKWQVVIDGTSLIVYIGLSILLFSWFGLYGFCVGVLGAFTVKLMVMVIILLYGTKMRGNL